MALHLRYFAFLLLLCFGFANAAGNDSTNNGPPNTNAHSGDGVWESFRNQSASIQYTCPGSSTYFIADAYMDNNAKVFIRHRSNAAIGTNTNYYSTSGYIEAPVFVMVTPTPLSAKRFLIVHVSIDENDKMYLGLDLDGVYAGRNTANCSFSGKALFE